MYVDVIFPLMETEAEMCKTEMKIKTKTETETEKKNEMEITLISVNSFLNVTTEHDAPKDEVWN